MRRAAASLAAVVAAATVASGCRHDDASPRAARNVVFSFFEDTPGMRQACPGLWAAHPDGEITPVAAAAALYPSFSFDGSLLSFGVFEDDDELDVPTTTLHVLDVESGDVTELAAGVAVFGPRVQWAPRRHELLAARVNDGGDRVELVVLDAEGGDDRVLARRAVRDAAWSPDGSRVAYTTGDALWVVQRDGRNERRLDEGSLVSVAWSPAGSRLAYRTDPNRARDTELIVRADGRGVARRLRTPWAHGFDLVGWLDEDGVLVSRVPAPRAFVRGREYGVGDLYRWELTSGATTGVLRQAIVDPVVAGGRGFLVLRVHSIEGEWVFTAAVAERLGIGERPVAAFDEQDVNSGSFPAWQPQPRGIAPAEGEFAPSAPESCADEIARLRDRLVARRQRR